MEEVTLTPLPSDTRARELWLQHAIGVELMRRMRQYALDRIPAAASEDARQVAVRAVDDTLYGLMQLVDGFAPPLQNDAHKLFVDVVGRLVDVATGKVVAAQSLHDGDGACMGVHLWLDRAFEPAPATPIPPFTPRAPASR